MTRFLISVATLILLFGMARLATANSHQFAPHGDGYYEVGKDIAPGLWRSNGKFDDCFWERLDSQNNQYDAHYGFAGGTVNIQPNDHRVRFLNCATWFYVENEVPQLQPDAYAEKSSGLYTVGIEIAVGTWVSDEENSGCYRSRLNRNQEIIEYRLGEKAGYLTIAPTDYEVELDGCGNWVHQGGGAGSSSGSCVIPPSGPWPPCATGGNQPPAPLPTPIPSNPNECVIPPSGPWPPCATGGNTSAPLPTPIPTQTPPNNAGCVIPPSGPWPPCATGGGSAPTPFPTPLATATPIGQQPTPTAIAGQAGWVVEVIDGESFTVDLGGVRRNVRLLGLDAPVDGDDCFFDSYVFLLDTLADTQVRLAQDVSDVDSFDYLLRYVYVEGLFVNEHVVREGFAVAAPVAPDTRHAQTLAAAEQDARNNGRGCLWRSADSTPSPAQPVPPTPAPGQPTPTPTTEADPTDEPTATPPPTATATPGS